MIRDYRILDECIELDKSLRKLEKEIEEDTTQLSIKALANAISNETELNLQSSITIISELMKNDLSIEEIKSIYDQYGTTGIFYYYNFYKMPEDKNKIMKKLNNLDSLLLKYDRVQEKRGRK